MTGMLASVSDPAEAQLVANCGVDIIDLKNPSAGALGAVSHEVAADVVRMIAGRIPVSATIGDLPMDGGLIEQAVFTMAKTGVDFIKIGLFENRIDEVFLNMLDRCRRNQLRIVLVVFADTRPDLRQLFDQLGRAPLYGIMLDTCDKHSGPLPRVLSARGITAFLRMAGQRQLVTGLAGSLRAADVGELVRQAPDYLGFRGALCEAGDRTSILSNERVTQIRALIPRQESMSERDLIAG